MSEVPPSQAPPPDFSNYPRPIGGPAYQRPPGVYFDTIGLAWDMVKSDFGTWIATILILGVISAAVSMPWQFLVNNLLYGSYLGATEISLPKMITSNLLGIVPGIPLAALTGGFHYMGVKQARGEPLQIGDLFIGFRHFVPLMLATLIYDVALWCGFALLVIPCFFVAGALAFVQILVIDQNLPAVEAVKLSYQTLRNHAWAMFALIFVAGLVSALGACACGIGLLFTAPIYVVTLGITYNYFFPRDAATAVQQIGLTPPS